MTMRGEIHDDPCLKIQMCPPDLLTHPRSPAPITPSLETVLSKPELELLQLVLGLFGLLFTFSFLLFLGFSILLPLVSTCLYPRVKPNSYINRCSHCQQDLCPSWTSSLILSWSLLTFCSFSALPHQSPCPPLPPPH